jgi:hypothetical protein
MDLNAYGPALMHRCRHAPMPSIHIHSRWSQYHQTAGKNYVRAVRNGQCADKIINKPSIVTNVILAIMPPAGNTFGLREYMLVKGKEDGLEGLQTCTDA